MRAPSPCFRYGYVLIASMSVACAAPAPPGAENVTPTPAMTADANLQDYQLRDLETHIQSMPQGPERDYFTGMLGARSGRYGFETLSLNFSTMTFSAAAPRAIRDVSRSTARLLTLPNPS
jgi:hypothetical protein